MDSTASAPSNLPVTVLEWERRATKTTLQRLEGVVLYQYKVVLYVSFMDAYIITYKI